MPFLPWLLVFVAIWFFVFRQIRQSNLPWLRKRGRVIRADGRSPATWVVAAIVTVVAVGLVLLRLHQLHAAPADPSTSPLLQILLPLAPWVVVVPLLSIFLRRAPVLYRRSWHVQKHLHRPMAVEFNEAGFTLSESLARHEYRWEYFPGFLETTNLFVIYGSPLSFQLVPKRAFANEAEIATVRDLLRRRTGQAAATGGFPVVPGQPAVAPPWPLSPQPAPPVARPKPPPLPPQAPESTVD